MNTVYEVTRSVSPGAFPYVIRKNGIVATVCQTLWGSKNWIKKDIRYQAKLREKGFKGVLYREVVNHD